VGSERESVQLECRTISLLRHDNCRPAVLVARRDYHDLSVGPEPRVSYSSTDVRREVARPAGYERGDAICIRMPVEGAGKASISVGEIA